MKEKLRFKLFGGIRIYSAQEDAWKPLSDYVDKGFGKKQQAFIAYLLLNHKRKISSTELMEQFWSEERKDPANSLKNMLHKVRAVFRGACPQHEDLILTTNSGYAWNSEVTVELDTEEFENDYQKSHGEDPQKRLEYQQQAFELYEGEILQGVEVDWLRNLNLYYRTVFIDLCKSLAQALQAEEQWEKVIRICRRGYDLDFSVEEFTLCHMHALVATGHPAEAIKHYEAYRTLLWNEYNLAPSIRVDQMYTDAVELSKGQDDFAKSLIAQLMQAPDSGGAFRCSLLVFQNLVQLELRHMARSGLPSSIVVLRAETMSGAEPTSTDIRRLERTLQSCLRSGDPFAHLNRGHFAVLLPTANEENAEKVMDRLCRNFYSNYPRSKAILRHHIFPLSSE